MKDLEEELLEKINGLGIGPGGLGGTTTAMAVNINTYPTHIAGLPVASCNKNNIIPRAFIVDRVMKRGRFYVQAYYSTDQ